MAQIIKEIRVDVSQPCNLQAILAKQYDCNSRFLKITLTDCGTKIDVSNTSKVTINTNRPDGQSKSFVGIANGDGTVTVPLPQWSLSIAGTLICDVSVTDTSKNERLTTMDIFVEVKEAANDNTDVSENPDGEIIVITPTKKISENSTDNEYPSAKAVYELDNITATASGKAITIDSANAPLQNLKLYGSTEQNGTPTPEAPIPLVSVGDSGSFEVGVYGGNILPYPYYNGASYTSNGVTFTADENGVVTVNGTSTATSSYYFINYPKIIVNETLYLNKFSTDNNIRMVAYYTLNDEGKWTTVSIPKGAIWKTCYLEISSGITINNATVKPIVSVGKVATKYEPYTKQTLTMPYTLRGTGEVKDEVDFARGVRIQRCASVDLGTLNWAEANNGKQMSSGTILGKVLRPIDNNTNASVICSAYQVDNANNIWNGIKDKSIGINTSGTVVVCDSNYTNATEFKNAMSGVILQYALVTPIETPLTETELNAYRQLMTNSGTTTILSGADAEISFYRNTPNGQATGNIHTQVNKDYLRLQQAIISTGGSTL